MQVEVLPRVENIGGYDAYAFLDASGTWSDILRLSAVEHIMITKASIFCWEHRNELNKDCDMGLSD
jgi:hypothetical protein